jgi:alkyl sulfatase BDS1-like metallo-beta-lactamase superfamily hydrolase
MRARHLSSLRDAHAYLHDQTLRLLGKGHTGEEIAEMIQLPPALAEAWHGDPVADRVKAIYQRHLGWSAALWLPPPAETARRSVESLGGMANVVALAREFVMSGDLRFAAELLRHAVYADPSGEVTKAMLAQVYERLGRDTEDATRHTFYVTGAERLRHGQVGVGMASTLPIDQIFDSLAIRVDAPAAWHETITIDWILPDGPYRTTLRHGVLIHHAAGDAGPADLTVRVSKTQLLGLLAGEGIQRVPHEGDPGALTRLLGYLDSDILAVA